MRIFLTFLAVTLFVTGCSTIIDKPTQNVRIETPGTEGAICYLEREDYRTRVWAPKTIRINKAQDPLNVRCLAPGNREKKVVIEPTFPTSTYMNLTNLMGGALIDYQTGAMFELPEVIEVDFTGMPAKPMPLPAYQQLLEEYPAIADLEEFRPGRSALQRDRHDPGIPMEKINRDFGPAAGQTDSDADTPGNQYKVLGGEKGISSTEDLTRHMNPQVFDSGSSGQNAPPAGTGPMPLAPF